MTTLVSYQFSESTAEDAQNYFCGVSQSDGVPQPSLLPDGVYRVVDGVLCRIVQGLPPNFDYLAPPNRR